MNKTNVNYIYYNIININYILNIISILYFIQQVMIENK